MTPLPVIGVPVPLAHLDGLDSLLSIVPMPAGVPVATVAVGGARNAGLLAVRILGASDDALRARMTRFQQDLREQAQAKGAALRARADQPGGEGRRPTACDPPGQSRAKRALDYNRTTEISVDAGSCGEPPRPRSQWGLRMQTAVGCLCSSGLAHGAVLRRR